MKKLILLAALVSLSACAPNQERGSTDFSTYAECMDSTVRYYYRVASDARPLTSDESDYYWHSIQDGGNCRFPEGTEQVR